MTKLRLWTTPLFLFGVVTNIFVSALAFSADKGKTAVILNTNARSVSPRLAPIACSIFGGANVFLTTSAEEAREAARSIVASSSNYALVVPVGGDGTLTRAINDLCDALMESNPQHSLNDAIRNLPLIGYVPLGTGNGVGSSVGCYVGMSPLSWIRPTGRLNKIQDVMEGLCLVGSRLKSRKDEDRFNVVQLPMIEVCPHPQEEKASAPTKKGDLCFFAGVGFDSLMLDDFKAIKAWSKRTGFLPRALGSVLGYSVALVTRTLPKALVRGEHKIQVKLSTRDQETLWVDHRRGDFVQPIAKNMRAISNYNENSASNEGNNEESVEIFSGTTGICCAGTSPYYGGGLRLFPFARLTLDQMHLRLGRINPLVGFVNIPKIFGGHYRETSERFGVIDFIGRDFEIEVERQDAAAAKDKGSGSEGMDGGDPEKGYPFQHSGESMGYFQRFRLRVTDEKIRFVNFMERRCISCGE